MSEPLRGQAEQGNGNRNGKNIRFSEFRSRFTVESLLVLPRIRAWGDIVGLNGLTGQDGCPSLVRILVVKLVEGLHKTRPASHGVGLEL